MAKTRENALTVTDQIGNGASHHALTVRDRQQLAMQEEIENKLLSLNRRIELLFDRPQGRIVNFMSTQPGGDSSKVVFQYAKLTAGRLRRRVLLLMAGPVTFPHPNGIKPWSEQWEQICSETGVLDECIQQMGDISLWYSQISGSLIELPTVMHDPRFEVLMGSFRTRFDLILIDSPSLTESASSVRLSAAADGVVLVVEAAKTRWQVIKNQVREIQINRGTVLGVVLNKRQYPIPDLIYKRL